MNGRAIRIGDDALVFVIRDFLGINLWNNQWNVIVIAILRRIVDDDATGRDGLRREFR